MVVLEYYLVYGQFERINQTIFKLVEASGNHLNGVEHFLNSKLVGIIIVQNDVNPLKCPTSKNIEYSKLEN